MLFELASEEHQGGGMLCIYRDRPGFKPIVIDGKGTHRPEWEAVVLDGLSEARPVNPEEWNIDDRWADGIRELGDRAERVAGELELDAVAFFRVTKAATASP